MKNDLCEPSIPYIGDSGAVSLYKYPVEPYISDMKNLIIII
jgi:hypothetical protein